MHQDVHWLYKQEQRQHIHILGLNSCSIHPAVAAAATAIAAVVAVAAVTAAAAAAVAVMTATHPCWHQPNLLAPNIEQLLHWASKSMKSS
jgi:hypothetical protein